MGFTALAARLGAICLAIALLAFCDPLNAQQPVRLPAPGFVEERADAVYQPRPIPEGQHPLEPLLRVPVAAPEPNAGLTLGEFESMALGGNPSLARMAARAAAARGNWLQVGLCPNPTVGYEGQQIGSGGRAEQDGLFVSQEFVRGGKLKLNRQVAAQEVARAVHDLAAQRERVLTDVHIAFYNVLVAQRQEQLARELAGIASEGMKAADALLRQMQVSKVDLLQAELELENANILAVNARNRRAAAWEALVTVAGNTHLELQSVSGDLEGESPQRSYLETLQRLLATSPEIAAAVANIERARWAAERARIETTPNVTVQGLVNWRDNGINGNPDGAITVGLPLPLWNRNQGGVVQAAQEAVAAEQALAQLELDLRNRLAPVFERYASALNQVTRYRARILPAAQESLSLTRRVYEAGEIGYVNLLTAQRTFSQTNLNYLEALRELRTTSAEIDGLLLSGSLRANP